MSYVAISGGEEAIRQTDRLNLYYRLKEVGHSIETVHIERQLRMLVDRVMSEGGLYAPDHAALALKQAEGDPFEAAFLLRSYRSTLARHHYSLPIRSSDMRVIRRISSAFRDIPGGQVLGTTYDFTHRLLNFDLIDEKMESISPLLHEFESEEQPVEQSVAEQPVLFPKVADRLRQAGLLQQSAGTESDGPFDITRRPMKFPVPRSARLQALTRGETGAMVSFAYSALRGYGATHPTIAELRVGYGPLYIPHPYDGESEEDAVYLGELKLTEVETVSGMDQNKATGQLQLGLGYGLCFGQNESKAIAMAILDSELGSGGSSPPQDEEFVLMHIDSIDSNGFVSHMKLPHYVSFQSKLDVMRQSPPPEAEEE